MEEVLKRELREFIDGLPGDAITAGGLVNIIAAAIKDERERCVKVVEEWVEAFDKASPNDSSPHKMVSGAVKDVAKAIRECK